VRNRKLQTNHLAYTVIVDIDVLRNILAEQLVAGADHVIDILDKYEKYITENKLKNGQVDVAHEYILEIYKQCMRDNDFALDEEDEKARKKAAQTARNKRSGGEAK